jgi:hypothetical protein
MDQKKCLRRSQWGSDPGNHLKSFPQRISLCVDGGVTPDNLKKNGQQRRE